MGLEGFFVHTLLALHIAYFNAELVVAMGEKPSQRATTHLAPVEEACVRDITQYVLGRNLCDVPDTEMVPSFLTPSTCANRCGVAKTYGSFLTCACDDKCVIYQDCCSDMLTHCPRVLARAKHAARQLPDVNLTCHGQILIVRENLEKSYALQSSIRPESSTQYVPTIETSTHGLGTTDFFKEGNVKLEDILVEYLTSLEVLDTELGVIFTDYFAFRSWRRHLYNMVFLPRENTLACLKPIPDPVNRRNFLRILPACLMSATKAVPTVFHRSCKWQSKVSCYCEPKFNIAASLIDACFHQNRLEFHSVSHTPIPYSDTFSPLCLLNGLPIYFKSSSEVTNVNKSIVNEPFTGYIGKLQKAVSMILKPLIVYDNRSTPQILSDDYVFLHNLPLEFVVEFTDTLEKRIRCPKFKSLLSDCHLEECAEGTFLVSKPLSPWSFNGMSCMLPGLVTVGSAGTHLNVSVCSCLRIANVVTALKVWKVKVMAARLGDCVLHLEHTSTENKPPQDIFDFSESLRKPLTDRFLGNLSFLSVMERMSEQMEKSRGTCKHEEEEENFDVCFYSWTLDEPEEQELAVCVRLGSSSSSEMGSGGAFVELVLVSAVLAIRGIIF